MKMVCRPGDPEYIEPGSKEYCEVLGCSQIASIVGKGYDSALDVWREKTHRAPKKAHKAIFDRGHDMEPIMARMLVDRYGRELKSEQVQYRDPDRPWLIYHTDGMFAKHIPITPDGEVYEGPGLWEAKAPGSRMVDTMLRDGITEQYLIQGQMGMHVAGCAMGFPIAWGTFGFLDYDEYELVAIDVKASWDFQQWLIERVERFWDCVISDTPPEPINPAEAPATPCLVKERFVPDDPEILAIVDELRMLTPAVKEAKDRKDVLTLRLKSAWEEYEKIEVPGVAKFSYGYSKPSEKIDGVGLLEYCEWLVGEYNRMAEFNPVAEALGENAPITFDRTQWVTPVEGSRTFRPTWAKD